MRRGTKIIFAIFIVAAIAMYIYIFAIPKIHGMTEQTTVIEYGDLPVVDNAEVLFIRDETLYAANQSGSLEYKQKEGTKVRKGVALLAIDAGGKVTSSSAIEKVRRTAGDAMEISSSLKASKTAVVSYYGDGYEKVLTKKSIAGLTWKAAKKYPEKSTHLKRKTTMPGDPVYKLTDNNLWYMVYWLDNGQTAGSGEKPDYAKGEAVRVGFGDTIVDAKVSSIRREGDRKKIVLKSDMYYSELTKLRKAKAEIIFAEYHGLIADKASMTERKGTPGLFVKQRSGSYKWVPVRILKTAGDRCTVSAGVYYDDEGKTVNTVNYYDEVLTDPKSEGYE